MARKNHLRGSLAATLTAPRATAFQTATKTRMALSNLLRTMTSRLTPHPLTIPEMTAAAMARRMEGPTIAAVTAVTAVAVTAVAVTAVAVTAEMGMAKARITRDI
jgi:hypothetical protein